MFGNHPLPNIGPSHLFHLPPPSHHPAIVAVPAVPLANAQMGQARAFSSTPTATPPLPPTPRHRRRQLHTTSPPSPTAIANRVRNVTAFVPPPISFRFERGQSYSRCPRFFLFRTGAVVFTSPPVSFCFERGWSYSRRPHFFLFRTGAVVFTPPPVSFH